MPLLRTGRNRIAQLIVGSNTCHWGTSAACIWVGASSVAFDAASTWPIGGTSTAICAATMESGYPTTGAATNIFEHRCVFGTAYANFAWDNWWINSATATSGTPLNWATTQALGTKTSAQSWQITTSISITT